MPLPDPRWLDVLRAQVAKPNVTKQAVADELGISRTAVSLLCDGKYTAKIDKVEKKIAGRVMALFANEVWCPHQHAGISSTQCQALASAPMAISNPDRFRQWRACQNCAENPNRKA